METFNIVVGIATILSFLVSLFTLCQVILIKQKINISDSSIGNTQRVKGNKNKTAGKDING